MDKPRIAVIWSRFGPYHLARLRGASTALPHATIIGLEVASEDRDYAWAVERGSEGFERVTAFPGQNYHDLSPASIADGIRASLERLKPDVVAINGWSVPEARAAFGWARRRRATSVLMSESKADDLARAWWKEAVKTLLVRRFDAALVGGQPQAEYLIQMGFPESRIRPGYDAIDNTHFEKHADEARAHDALLRSRLDLPQKYFFACTRFLPRKNLDGLLRAYALYRADVAEPWSLVVAGSGSEDQALRKLAQALDVASTVKWAGFVQYPDLPIYFGLAAAFVHPAKTEAWGLVVNEAAASGVPLLVARPVGAAAELVREGETGFLFDPYDHADICRALTKISNQTTEARAHLGRNARDLAAQWGPARFGSELAALVFAASRETAAHDSRR